jgi:DNA-binding transcriptional LysR family regulator
MDRFENLRAFKQVVESGSLTSAAERLGVATSAISRRVKDLEEHLGTQLLQRTTRQMRLTSAGERFYDRANGILNALEEAEAEAGDTARSLSGPLRVAAPLSFGQMYLAPLLIEFAQQHPELLLDVDFSDRMVDLVAEGYDMAIRAGSLSDSTLVARKLTEFPTVVSASPDFWERMGLPDAPEALIGLPALCYAGSDRGDVWRFKAPDGRTGQLPMTVAMRATNGEFLCDAAAEGIGVVMQPSFICHGHVRDGRLRPVFQDHSWNTVTVYAVYPQTRHLSTRARALIDFLRARIPEAASKGPDMQTA